MRPFHALFGVLITSTFTIACAPIKFSTSQLSSLTNTQGDPLPPVVVNPPTPPSPPPPPEVQPPPVVDPPTEVPPIAEVPPPVTPPPSDPPPFDSPPSTPEIPQTPEEPPTPPICPVPPPPEIPPVVTVPEVPEVPVVPEAKEVCPSQVMRYEIPAQYYPGGGYCEGFVYFAPDVSTGRYAPWVNESIGYLGEYFLPADPNDPTSNVGSHVQATGSTDYQWYENGEYPNIGIERIRSTNSHNGKAYIMGHHFAACSITAVCQNGVATAVDMSW